MSLALRVTSVSSFVYGCLYNGGEFHARTDFLRPSGLRFATNRKLRLLKSSQVHRLCKWRDGFSSVAARFCAASSFNDSVGDFEDFGRVEGGKKDCGRVEGGKKEAENDNGSDTNTGYGNGNKDSRGGGDNGGTGSGGLGESADWEGMIWFCWRIYKAWSYYFDSPNRSSSIVVRSGVGDTQVNIKGRPKKMADPTRDPKTLLEPLLMAILEPLLVALFVPCLMIALAVCAALLAGVLLFGCVVAALIWFWRS